MGITRERRKLFHVQCRRPCCSVVNKELDPHPVEEEKHQRKGKTQDHPQTVVTNALLYSSKETAERTLVRILLHSPSITTEHMYGSKGVVELVQDAKNHFLCVHTQKHFMEGILVRQNAI